MKKLFLLTVAAVSLSACAGSPTTGQWSCRATLAGKPCSDIEEIDAAKKPSANMTQTADDVLSNGAKPARWWARADWPVKTRQDEPYRQGDQVMKVVVAPYVDASGDYHGRSEVYAVVKKADWWVQPPVPVAAQPAVGQSLPADGASKDMSVKALPSEASNTPTK